MANSVIALKVLASAVVILIASKGTGGVTWSWEKWWTYDGISGPDYWGVINPEWSLCSKGRRQSPIDVDPARLLYDPNLRQLHVDKHSVSGVVENTRHSVEVKLDGEKTPLNISGGPLSYRYQLKEIQLHFGSSDFMGSEHTVNGVAFPGEIQVLGYNSQLYSNFSHALDKAYGIVGISVLLKIGKNSNEALKNITDKAERLKYVGSSFDLEAVNMKDLLPESRYFITYEGSTTYPACHETVTWIILNKPAYISKKQLLSLREITQVNATQVHESAQVKPRTLADNFRRPQKLHHRPIRTNIDFSNAGGENCPSMQSEARYIANAWNTS